MLEAFTTTEEKPKGSHIRCDPARIRILREMYGITLCSKDADDVANPMGTLTGGLFPRW